MSEDTHAKAVGAAATKIYEALEGPISDQDFKRQQRQAALAARMSVAAITAYLAAMRAEGWVMVRDCGEDGGINSSIDTRRDYAKGWNKARTAMLKGVGDGNG